MEGGSRSNGTPPEGFADPVTSNGIGFRSNIPVNKLIKHVTRAIEASDVASTPPVAETTDGRQSQNELTLDRIPATHRGSGKARLATRPNTRSWNDHQNPK